MQIHSVGIDLGKTTFHLVALGAVGKVLVKKKFSQKQLLAFLFTVIVAHLSYQVYERPFLKLKRRFTIVPSRD